MLLEARMRSLAPRMGVKLIWLIGTHSFPHDDPVQFTWGSNSITVDCTDLEPLMDLLDTEQRIYPAMFMSEYIEPFFREHAK